MSLLPEEKQNDKVNYGQEKRLAKEFDNFIRMDIGTFH